MVTGVQTCDLTNNMQKTFHHGHSIGVNDGMGLGLAKLLDQLLFFIGPAKKPVGEPFEGLTQARGPRVGFGHAGAWKWNTWLVCHSLACGVGVGDA